MRRISILVCTIALCLPFLTTGCDRGAEERAKLEKVEKELAELKTTVRETQSERDDLKSEVADVVKKRDELQEQVTTLTGEEKILRDQIAKLTSSSQRLDRETTNLTRSIEKLTEQLKEITDSRDKLQGDVTKLQSSRDALQIQVKELTKQRDEAIAKEHQAQQELTALKAAAASIAAAQTVSEPNDGMVAVTETPKVESIKPPTIHSFASARTKVDKGQSATLTWHVSNASDIRIDPGIGPVSALGSTNVKPKENTTYKLNATNDSGTVSETCTIEVR